MSAAPFQFSTRLTLRESTGLRAVSLGQLLKHLKTVPGAVIFHHTHHYLQQHQSLTPEPPNDFAYWVTEVLGDKVLGEQLASVDTIQFASLRALRERLIETIDQHLRGRPRLRFQAVPPDEALYLLKAISIVVPTPYRATTLEAFAGALQAVTINSLYFHIFEARLRLERGNDFAKWFESLGEPALARAVMALDPYTHTMEELRRTILALIGRRLQGKVA